MAKKRKESGIIHNRKAFFNYTVIDKYEAGIVLEGCEVKSVRSGNADLKDSYVRFYSGEPCIVNMYIKPYEMTTDRVVDPTRKRKLLLHKKEIIKLRNEVSKKGFAIVPLKLYFKRGYAKLEIGLCKGKHLYDKRESLKKKAERRELRRFL